MEPTSTLLLLKILLPVVLVVFFIALSVVILNQHFRQNLFKQLLEKEALRAEYQADLLRANLEAQEAERRRIAQDLHDDIGATLAVSKIYVSQLKSNENSGGNPSLHKQINELFDQIASNIRTIAHDLSPVILEKMGLVASIETMESKLQAAGIEFIFTMPGQFHFIKKSEIHLYRIVSELIANTLKHANATTIKLGIWEKGSNIVVTYQDNGVGFSQKDLPVGLGMKGIEGRIAFLKGSFESLNCKQGVHFQILIPKPNIVEDGNYQNSPG